MNQSKCDVFGGVNFLDVQIQGGGGGVNVLTDENVSICKD